MNTSNNEDQTLAETLVETTVAERRRELVAGAVRYSQFDKSDPFAFRRAMTHIRCGVVDDPAKSYNAKRGVETRTYTSPLTGKSREWEALVFTDAKRP